MRKSPLFQDLYLFSWDYGTKHTMEVGEIQLNITNIFAIHSLLSSLYMLYFLWKQLILNNANNMGRPFPNSRSCHSISSSYHHFFTIFYHLFSEACVLCFLRLCPLSSICKHPCPAFFTIAITLMTKALQQLRVTQPCSIVELCSGKLIILEQLFKTVPQEVSNY